MQQAIAIGRAIAKPDIASGFCIEHEGEILARHRGFGGLVDLIGPDDARCGGKGDGGFGFAVDRGGVAALIHHARGATECARGGIGHGFKAVFDQILNVGCEGAHGAADGGGVGDDIPCVARENLGRRDHRTLQRIDIARGNGLQGQQQLGEVRRAGTVGASRRPS